MEMEQLIETVPCDVVVEVLACLCDRDYDLEQVDLYFGSDHNDWFEEMMDMLLDIYDGDIVVMPPLTESQFNWLEDVLVQNTPGVELC